MTVVATTAGAHSRFRIFISKQTRSHRDALAILSGKRHLFTNQFPVTFVAGTSVGDDASRE
jgi:hypothetical protein